MALIVLVLGAAGVIRANQSFRFSDGTDMALGMIFLAVSAVMIVGLFANWRWRMKQHQRDSHVCYAITDRRAIVWTPEPSGNAVKIKTFRRGEVRNVVRIETPEGSGSVLFGSCARFSL